MVGNPSGDLPFAGTEARAIHDAFHPRGTFLGDGEPVLPQDVLDWIATAPAGPSVLHFACHGAVVPDRPADAHLVLSGGHRLAVRTLIDASRLAALNIDRVFLAACTTNVIGSDHDEALSLSTAFLAAGQGPHNARTPNLASHDRVRSHRQLSELIKCPCRSCHDAR